MPDPLSDKVVAHLNFDWAIADDRGNAVTYDHASIVHPAIVGAGSLQLFGGTVEVTLADLVGAGDLAVEAWIETPGEIAIGSKNTVFYVPGMIVTHEENSGDAFLVFSVTEPALETVGSVIVGPSTRVHVEFSRAGGLFYAFANGALLGTLQNSTDLGADAFYIGRLPGISYGDPAWPVFSGKMDEFRLTDGAARHTAGFTPELVVLPIGTPATFFSVRVLLDGDDVSDDVIGDLVVEAEEGAARVADFTMKPAPLTEVFVPGFVGKPVVISFGDFSSGTLTNEVVLFTGKVDRPAVDLDARVINFRCTDDLQGVVSAMSVAAINTLIGGYYSSAVFDAGASRWGYANDRLSTVAAAMDISPTGTLRLTDWAAKSTADMEFYEESLLDGSLAIDIAERAAMTNQIDLVFSYRFPRIKSEGYACVYDALDGIPYGWGGYVNQNLAVPTRDLVRSAIESSGGSIESITYDALPTSATIIYGPGGVEAGVWIPNPATDPLLCTGWNAVVSFGYSQEIEEVHEITIAAPLSIAEIGAIREGMSGALQGEYPDISAAETSVTLYQNKITGIPPVDTAPVVVGMTNSVDVALSTDTNRAAADSAMETLIAVAKARIAAAHRSNLVSAEVPLDGAIDLDKTVRVGTAHVDATGKVRRLVHTINSDSGRATTRFDLAISSIAGVGITHPGDPITAPPGTDAGASNELGDPVIVFNNGTTEDHTLTITFPGVESSERQKAAHIITSSYDAELQEDPFSVTL